jgi:hypothetical protein
MQENAGLRTIYKQISAGRQQHWSVVTRRILVAEFLLDLLDSNYCRDTAGQSTVYRAKSTIYLGRRV